MICTHISVPNYLPQPTVIDCFFGGLVLHHSEIRAAFPNRPHRFRPLSRMLSQSPVKELKSHYQHAILAVRPGSDYRQVVKTESPKLGIKVFEKG